MKLLKYAVLPALVALTLGSCKKQLELRPTDTLSPETAFRTLADAQLGANEAYGRFGARANKSYQSALVSDEGKLGRDNAGQGALTYRYQYSADNTTGGDVTSTWGSSTASGLYTDIDQINRVLTALPNVIIASPAEETRRNVLKGQLMAMRAAAHFEILEAYAKNYDAADPKGIPYVTVSNPTATPARLSIGETVTKIETELNDAFALLPAVTSTTFTDTVFNQVNVNVYRARVALYKKDYQKAIDYSTAVISSAVRTLSTGTEYTGIWTDAAASANAEVLFRIRYLTGTAIGAMWTTVSGPLIYVAPSEKLRLSYGTGDIRRAAFIGGTTDAYYVNKFYTSAKGGRIVDLKVARMSEVYLMRAEAYSKLATPNVTAGAADLNAVRAKRITGYVDATFGTAADLLTAVLDERFKELCFEGFRFWDLKRNNLPVERLAADVASTAWQTLPAGNFRFVFPVPQDELLANPNAVQNDGY